MTPSLEQISVLEKWATDTAAALAPELDEMGRFKVMIGLLQARALECRHVGGMLLINAGQSRELAWLARQLSDRSAKLEGYGMDIAKRKMEISSTGQGEGIQ